MHINARLGKEREEEEVNQGVACGSAMSQLTVISCLSIRENTLYSVVWMVC
jgi:hypothetical protein